MLIATKGVRLCIQSLREEMKKAYRVATTDVFPLVGPEPSRQTVSGMRISSMAADRGIIRMLDQLSRSKTTLLPCFYGLTVFASVSVVVVDTIVVYSQPRSSLLSSLSFLSCVNGHQFRGYRENPNGLKLVLHTFRTESSSTHATSTRTIQLFFTRGLPEEGNSIPQCIPFESLWGIAPEAKSCESGRKGSPSEAPPSISQNSISKLA